ncbi:MAG: hypothetical protein AAF086_09085, partial [Planctomycetota bacterium]
MILVWGKFVLGLSAAALCLHLIASPALAAPPSSGVSGGEGKAIKFDSRPVKPSMRLKINSLLGRELDGRLVAWDGGGFVLVSKGRVVQEVPWWDLAAEDVAEVRGELITRFDTNVANEWFQLGQHLLQRQHEPAARDLALKALEHASQLDADLIGKIRQAIDDTPPPEEVNTEEWLDEMGPQVPTIPTEAEIATNIPASFTGTWPVPHEPYEIALALRDTFASGAGAYHTDHPKNHHKPEMVQNRTKTTWDDPGKMPSFYHGNIYPDWWNEKYTTGDILGAMARQDPVSFYRQSNNWLRLYVQVLAEGDIEMARPAAEAYVRTCPPEELPRALELLAAVYQRLGADALHTKMLRDGADFQPTTRRLAPEYQKMGVFQDTPVAQGRGDFETLRDKARTSIARGDVKSAQKWLKALDGLSLSNADEASVNTLYLRLMRVTDRIAAALRTEPEELVKVQATMARLSRNAKALDASGSSGGGRLADRLDELSTTEILTELQHAVNVFGCHSSPAADRLLYLLEERRWSGLEIDARTLYYITFFINKYYEPARAVAA